MSDNGSKHRLAAVISYCTTDHAFIQYTIEGLRHHCQDTIVVVSDHFYDGRPEDQALIARTQSENPEARFIQIPYDQATTDEYGNWIWFGLARLNGFLQVDPGIEYVIFADADEVIEKDRFGHWLDGYDYRRHDAIFFQSYWYFREPRFRATTIENAPAMVRRDAVDQAHFIHPKERLGFMALERVQRDMAGLDGHPMVHHYSWVRTREGMLAKTSSFGHKYDRDWPKLIEQEFSGPFSGRDFVHGYTYEQVTPYIDWPP